MKNKIIFSFLIGLIFTGCSPTVNDSSPSLSGTSTSDPSPTTLIEEEFQFSCIKGQTVTYSYFWGGSNDNKKYSSETYNIDNVFLTSFDRYYFLEYEIVYSGSYSIEEIELSFERECCFLFSNDNKFVWLGKSATFAPRERDGRTVFYLSNYDVINSDSFEESVSPFTLKKVKYNNRWIDILENNTFTTCNHPEEDIGYDLIKNSDKEVIIDFSNYTYRDDVSVSRGTQLDSYTYIFEKEGEVTLSFSYKWRNLNLKVERTIDIKFVKLSFNEGEDLFEIVETDYSTVYILNIMIDATFGVYGFSLLIDNIECKFDKSDTYYLKGYGTSNVECFNKLMNKDFSTCVMNIFNSNIDVTSYFK